MKLRTPPMTGSGMTPRLGLVEGVELLGDVLEAPAGGLEEFLVVVGEVAVLVLRAADDAFDEGGTLFDLALEALDHGVRLGVSHCGLLLWRGWLVVTLSVSEHLPASFVEATHLGGSA
jgi:hypothetical protein